jgi:hypothetical protein
MPLFYFTLKDGFNSIPDCEGEEFADEASARVHATAVARELMRNRTVQARTWRLQVSDDYLQPCFELLFASIDDSLAHLAVESRKSIETACRNTASLKDTIIDIQLSLLQVRGSLNRFNDIVAFTSAAAKPRV